ncbi:phage tail assembly chaperone [Pseudomonas sichuanensis]|uniref:phage tail assembly chaperone n=1 Tax=Pseudomonas sichuanensis TaxID=2213015 RepID=UPI00215E2C15|nr:phage tail assembly chaperone [Pseudomonas sichuanensis]UVK81973.1 phage tail assembly chaperone [Pseudomonas sichuanensis]
MSYAIRNDRSAQRTVAGPEDVGPGEFWNATPIEIVPLPPTSEESAAKERGWRDAELNALVWWRDRHRDQLEIGAGTTMTPEQFSELLVFMQALRDWPQSPAFPDSSARPVPPAFIEQVGGEP